MSQTELPFQKAREVCVFCTSPKGKPVEIVVKFVHLDDSHGNHYALVNLPTCKEHEHLPTIHERGRGVKP